MGKPVQTGCSYLCGVSVTMPEGMAYYTTKKRVAPSPRGCAREQAFAGLWPRDAERLGRVMRPCYSLTMACMSLMASLPAAVPGYFDMICWRRVRALLSLFMAR